MIDAKTPETEGKLIIELEGSADMVRDERMKSKTNPALQGLTRGFM